jgi:hypothetical protein
MTCNAKKEYWESEYFHLQDPIVCYIYIWILKKKVVVVVVVVEFIISSYMR